MDSSDESIMGNLFSNQYTEDFFERVPGSKKLMPLEREARDREQQKKFDEALPQRQEAARLKEEERTVTAQPLAQMTEQERRSRRRRSSALPVRGGGTTLGRAGLLGGGG